MYHTIIKQWKTVDGKYYSSTVDKKDYDIAIGDFHAMFKPMQNDQNVAYFRLQVVDEFGADKAHCSWTRPQPIEEVE